MLTTASTRSIRSKATKSLAAAALGAASGTTIASISAPSPFSRGSRKMHFDSPEANIFCLQPMFDFPLDRKILITENIDSGDGTYEQHDTVHGTGGAITLSFDAKKWTPSGPSLAPQPTWTESQVIGDGSFSPDRPIRLAIASTGISKGLVREVAVQNAPYVFWDRFELPNFAVKGEDVGGLTGEDAIAVGHCGTDSSDTRHEYVPVNKQSSHLMDKLHLSLRTRDDIERVRYFMKGQGYPKDVPLQGGALLSKLSQPHSDRASLSTLLINDTNTERITFREKYIQTHPDLADQLLDDDQLRQIRAQLHDPTYDHLFLNTTLPLPVVTPVHSYTQKADGDQYGSNDADFANLSAKEVFGQMNKDQPLTSAAVIAVSDGVGGMVSYGDKNNTKEMSHLLMRSIRHNLTNDPAVTARDLLGQAHTSLLRHNSIMVGACTASIGVLRPTDPEEPEDEFDDGRRLKLSIANVGDSTVFAFRPKHNHDLGTVTYIPLAMTWPMHHSGKGPQLPPVQFTIFDYPGRPALVVDPNASSDMSTTLSTSHFSTPTLPNSGPSGGSNFFSSKVDYLAVLAGKKPFSDMLDHLAPTPQQATAVNFFANIPADHPWMAQSVEDVKLRRGDVVCALSDGITDNLAMGSRFLSTPAELWETVVSYVHPAVRAQHPATRNVRPLRQVPGKRLDHISGAILPKFNKTPLKETLLRTDEILSKIADPQIPPYDPEDASQPYLSLRPIPSHESTMLLDTNQSTPRLIEKHLEPSPLNDQEKECLHKYNYLMAEGVRYHSTLTGDAEAVVAGTLSSAMAGGFVRLSQRGTKLDDMSVVVAVVY